MAVGKNVQDTQPKYYDDQETFTLDFDDLESKFITSVDSIRSHYNALASSSQELNTPQYQESRCHAFFRMIGFPIVASNGYHSPGYDPNLNTDFASQSSYNQIDNAYLNNRDVVGQVRAREQVVNDFNKIFANGGISAQAVALGSIFVRSFKSQFSNTDPLIPDASQIQNINERVSQVMAFYGPYDFTNTQIQSSSQNKLLTSRHILKPFVVDPRIDGYVRPIKNRICAPFLKDKSQTQIFTSSSGASGNESSAGGLARPYIERVITVRFNNNDATTNPGQDYINTVINQIKNDQKIVDQDLINTISNTLDQLYSSELTIFNNYYKIIRSVIDHLVRAIRDVQYIRQNINFNPVPSVKFGVEGGVDGGGKLAAIDPLDKNNENTETERNLIQLSQNQAFNNMILDAGLQGVPDLGDFAFSNLDDLTFSINKNIQQSYSDNITKLTNYRNQLGNEGITSLRVIELVMGEFSGLGLIDMVAIQAALWIMPENSLLGLIDKRAFDRITSQARPDINLIGAAQNDIITSLKDFESTLKTIYLLIQDYYDGIYDGSGSSIS